MWDYYFRFFNCSQRSENENGGEGQKMPEFYKKWAKATLTGGFCPAFVITSMIYSKESLSPVAGY